MVLFNQRLGILEVLALHGVVPRGTTRVVIDMTGGLPVTMEISAGETTTLVLGAEELITLSFALSEAAKQWQ